MKKIFAWIGAFALVLSTGYVVDAQDFLKVQAGYFEGAFYGKTPTGQAVKVLEKGTSNQTYINGTSSVALQIDGTSEAVVSNNALSFTDSAAIKQSTSDAADNESTALVGGGDIATSRGAYAVAYGNEEASGLGRLDLNGGNVSTGNINAVINNASAKVRVLNSSGNELWGFDNTGALSNGGASLGGSINLSTTGTTVALQEGTAASACMGTVTFNGTTAVTKSTTCAATGARIFLTPTSDPTGATAAYCWVTNIVNGTSFDVDCDQANDGTANWIIFKEAP